MEANIQVLQAKQDKKSPNYLGETVLVILDLDNYV